MIGGELLIIIALVSVLLAFGYAGLLDLVTIYMERKMWGKIMQRYGPTHVATRGCCSS